MENDLKTQLYKEALWSVRRMKLNQEEMEWLIGKLMEVKANN